MSKPSFADVMASSKNGRRRVIERVCFSPDINERYAELEAELLVALNREQKADAQRDPNRPNTSRRLAGGELESTRIANEMATLIDDNPEAFYDLAFEQARRHDWLGLRTQHPPRDSVAADAGIFNSETFGPAAVRLCLVDPEPTDEVMAFLDENLSTGEWERLTMRVWALNEGGRNAPKSRLASSILSGSDAE